MLDDEQSPVPTTIKFALPEVSQEEVAKSEGQSKLSYLTRPCKVDMLAVYFRHLDVPAFEPAPLERLAGPPKRKLVQQIQVKEVTVKRQRTGMSESNVRVRDRRHDGSDTTSDIAERDSVSTDEMIRPQLMKMRGVAEQMDPKYSTYMTGGRGHK